MLLVCFYCRYSAESFGCNCIMPNEANEENHTDLHERNLTVNDNIDSSCGDLDTVETNTHLIESILMKANQEGSQDSEINVQILEDNIIQNDLNAQETDNHEFLNHDSNFKEDENDDSDDSSEYIRRRVAELNAELLKEKEYYAENHEKRTRVNFHPQLVQSWIINENGCEELLDFSRNEGYELTRTNQSSNESINTADVSTGTGSYQRSNTSVIPQSVENNETNNFSQRISNQESNNSVKAIEKQLTDNKNKVTRQGDEKKKQKYRDDLLCKDMTETNIPKRDQKNGRLRSSGSGNYRETSCRPSETEKEAAIKLENKKLREKKFTDWLKAKSLQKQHEEEMIRRENEERDYLMVVHSRKACDKAFKQTYLNSNSVYVH
ncbi:unnamed protein product [Heterobilharzia americana]|nr:unnamed protein product [Heterobilharzia americana]